MQTDITKRLPVEVLALIFQAYRDAYGGRRRGLFVHWVRATWVCKRWRDVALDTPTLWSTILVSKRLASHPALETQLNRARGVRLDLLVSCEDMPDAAVADVFDLVLSKTKSVKRLKIIPSSSQATIVKTFVHSVAAEITSLSVLPDSEEYFEDDFHWTLAADVLPRLRHLALSSIIPLPGTPLLHLTQLEVSNAFYDHLAQEQGYLPHLHTFLIACPNLESLRSTHSFEYAYQYGVRHPRIEQRQLPMVTLPRLRRLYMEELALDVSEALDTLRLPSLSSFHITAVSGDDFANTMYYVIPRNNICEALPPIRHSCCLSLAVGAEGRLTLQGSSGDTLGEGSYQWSITSISLAAQPEGDDFYFLGDGCKGFLGAIPTLVIPTNLVHLELHLAHGMPVERDWVRFLETMPHLRKLAVGGGALLRNLLPALERDQGLCAELEELELCATPGPDVYEDVLAEFIPEVVVAWAHRRAQVSKPLRSLRVWTPTEDSDSDGGEPRTGLEGGTELGVFASKLRDNLAALGNAVRNVFVETKDCDACASEYDEWEEV